MTVEIDLPQKYERRLEDIEEVEPTIRDQIEVEVLPEVLRLINDAHQQLQQQEQRQVLTDDQSAE